MPLGHPKGIVISSPPLFHPRNAANNRVVSDSKRSSRVEEELTDGGRRDTGRIEMRDGGRGKIEMRRMRSWKWKKVRRKLGGGHTVPAEEDRIEFPRGGDLLTIIPIRIVRRSAFVARIESIPRIEDQVTTEVRTGIEQG